MGFGHGDNYPGMVWFLLNGLVAFFIFLVVVGLVFLLVRFLLTATTAAKIYIAKNSPRTPPTSTPHTETSSGGYTPAPPAESSVASPPTPPAAPVAPEGPPATPPSTAPTTPVAKAPSKPRTPKTPPAV